MEKVKMAAVDAEGVDDILPLIPINSPFIRNCERIEQLKHERPRRALPAALLTASLLATSLLPLAIPAHAADITINSPVSGNVYGNSSSPDGSVPDQIANGNSVTITTGGDVNDAFGGYATDNTTDTMASNNNIQISGGKAVDVFGGAAGSDTLGTVTASNNTVTISDGAVGLGSAGVLGGRANGGTATANKNSIAISGGTVAIISSGVAGGDANADGGTATANENTVTISGGTVTIPLSSIRGGDASGIGGGTATANDNAVTINDGTTVQKVYGGLASGSTATANNNTITINGGMIDEVFGGDATGSASGSTAAANNNTITINGGTITNGVFGGATFVAGGTSTTSGNTIFIRGGTISGLVAGGAPGGYTAGVGLEPVGTAQNNTITIEGSNSLNLEGANIYGTFGSNITQTGMTRTLDHFSGNTFNLKRSGVTVAGLYNFENLNFYLPTNLGNGGTMLTVTDAANIDKSTVNVGINGAASPLRAGDKVNLINAKTLTGKPANNNGIVRGNGMGGVTWLYNFKVYTQGNQLIAEVEGDKPAATSSPSQPPPSLPTNPGAKALSGGFIAPVTTVNQGLTFASTKGIDQAVQAASSPAGGGPTSSSGGSSSAEVGGGQEGGEQGVGGIAGVMQSSAGARPFGAISGGSMSYDTGSSIDVDSISVIAGLSKAIEYEKAGRLTLGGFVEYGYGSYDTSYNSSQNQVGVHGGGDIDNFGAGILGRLDLRQFGEGISAGRFYADASARLGQVRSDFDSDLSNPQAGPAASFETDSLYYGGHAGGGYLMAVTDTSQADFYARFLWTHQEGDDVRLSTGEPYTFDAVDSLRTVLGARYTWVAKPWLVPYVGAAWEHEFDGDTGSATNYDNVPEAEIDKTSLGGDTGMAEIGLNMGSNAGSWAFDLGVQGYAGAREGVSGTVRVVYRW